MDLHIFVSGFVQGVGYRQFVKHNALKLGIKGWVKNLKDNRVEAFMQGSKEDLEKMLSICKKGPFLSEVEDIEVFWDEEKMEKEYSSFEVIV